MQTLDSDHSLQPSSKILAGLGRSGILPSNRALQSPARRFQSSYQAPPMEIGSRLLRPMPCLPEHRNISYPLPNFSFLAFCSFISLSSSASSSSSSSAPTSSPASASASSSASSATASSATASSATASSATASSATASSATASSATASSATASSATASSATASSATASSSSAPTPASSSLRSSNYSSTKFSSNVSNPSHNLLAPAEQWSSSWTHTSREDAGLFRYNEFCTLEEALSRISLRDQDLEDRVDSLWIDGPAGGSTSNVSKPGVRGSSNLKRYFPKPSADLHPSKKANLGEVQRSLVPSIAYPIPTSYPFEGSYVHEGNVVEVNIPRWDGIPEFEEMQDMPERDMYWSLIFFLFRKHEDKLLRFLHKEKSRTDFDVPAAFEAFRNEEVVLSRQEKGFLVRPSGSINTQMAVMLHWPTFTTKAHKLENGEVFDPCNPCLGIMAAKGLSDNTAFIVDMYCRRARVLSKAERSRGETPMSKHWSPELRALHKKLSFGLVEQSTAKVWLWCGNPVQEEWRRKICNPAGLKMIRRTFYMPTCELRDGACSSTRR